MSAPTFMNNPNYVEYVRLLRQLHRLIAEGNDGDEADALRDDMDAPWYALSEEEIARIRGLSADLYTLDEDRQALVQPPNGLAVDSLRARLKEAAEARDWDAALELLRQHSHVLPSHEEAFLRGWYWKELEDHDTAALFFERAAELDPQNAKYPVAVMEARIRAGHIEEALRYARTILDPAAQNVA